MIYPLDNERYNRGITFKQNKIMRKQINNLMIALAFILTIGCLVGCVKQLAYLKEHEQEIVDFVKAQNSKVESVQVDWNSMQIEESGNGTPQGGGYNLSISGKINQLENTKFSVDFYLEDQNSIPTIKKMGMLHDIYIEENGGWKIFS